ncbi:MAG: hypothetical protein WCC84_01885 [Candidatus Cybelea sp.]
MPLQNRVTPFGEIVALPGRGLVMGNRGILHNDDRRVVRNFAVKRWIACVLEFRGRHRAVMTPHRYTELFFLDEAAALSAGHRPCAECRNADYKRFRTLWEACFGGPANADGMDGRLHGERVAAGGKRTYREDLASLPDGAYVALDGKAWLVWGKQLHEWSDAGYRGPRPRPVHREIEVLTPVSIIALLAAGYCPEIHPTAVNGVTA